MSEDEPVSSRNDIVVTARAGPVPGDPFQAANVKSFAVTQSVDRAVVGPVALGYKRYVPSPIRSGLRNFFVNLHEPDTSLNFLIQLKVGKAMETLGRFAINSTIGAAGLFDIARRKPFKLPHRPNGLADSFGYYGIRPGPFFFIPLVGPTTLRDLIGNGLDSLFLPTLIGKPFTALTYAVPSYIVRSLDRRAEFDGKLNELRDDNADPYAASRAYYLDRRQVEIDNLRNRHHGDGNSAREQH